MAIGDRSGFRRDRRARGPVQFLAPRRGMRAHERIEQPVLQRLQRVQGEDLQGPEGQCGECEPGEQAPHSLRRRQISVLSAAWLSV